MPENDHAHPRRTLDDEAFTQNPPSPFVELGLTSCFAFLRGASDAVDLARQSWALGYDSLCVSDFNTLAGVVRIWSEANKACLRPIIGCRVTLISGDAFLVYPRDREAYARLSRMLTKGKRHDVDGTWQAKGLCDITLNDLVAAAEGQHMIAVPGEDLDAFSKRLPHLLRRLPWMRYIAASYLYRADDVARITRLDRLAGHHGLSILATNDVLYHVPDRRPLQDVMTCIRHKCTLATAGFHLEQNAERHLKSPEEMMRLFSNWPHAITATRQVADSINFDLSELAYEYPSEVIPKDMSPQAYLEQLTWEGAARRYPGGVPEATHAMILKELDMIQKLDIAQYFLTIQDIIHFARHVATPPILCQGRGSAANSAVCYVLGITAVDPAQHDLLFERFISEERKEPPDIDVDFEHERREEVIQHIYAKYGRDRAGLCATVIHYRPRSAIREVGKVMGLSEDVTGALAKTVWGSWGRDIADKNADEAGLDMTNPLLRRTMIIAQQMIGMPRHLGQHVGGFILTERALCDTVPIGNGAMADRSFIEWDKDDIDALGILKVDILALGMLTCIRKCFDMISAHYDRDLTLHTTPREDAQVYDMLCQGDSVGVFQVESRAQMNMLPRLRPRQFYDLVIQVAIVRPGPIQGDMVHPYLRRRNGEEAVQYPSPAAPHNPSELKNILGRTLGVPIFQEQAMKIAIDAADFSPAEANELRKAMATFRSKGTIGLLEQKMVSRMVMRGYDEDFATRCFNQIKGFGDYGFPESHAASFAQLVYVSSWLKCFYPDVFCAALLNSQPMGFYAPAQIVRDAREHGVEIRPPDVNFSDWDSTLEPTHDGWAVRLGLRQISGLRQDAILRMMDNRSHPYADFDDLQKRGQLTAATIRKLAEGDALGSLWVDRRQALWDAKGLRDAPDLPLFQTHKDEGTERVFPLPVMPICEQVVADYQTLRLSLKAHPLSFMRKSMTKQGFSHTAALRNSRNWQKIKLAGLVLIRQKPGSAKGVCFITLEDEFGTANLVVWPKVFEQFRKTVMQSRLLVVEGYVQRDVDIIHIVAQSLINRTDALQRLAPDDLAPTMAPAMARADEVNKPLPAPTSRHPRNVQIIPKSRDFH